MLQYRCKNKKEEKMKKTQLLLPCYEHDIREWWEQHLPPLTSVYKLTPEEELEAKEDERLGRLLDKLELGEAIDQEKLSKDERLMIWKIKYQKGGIND
jgi:ribosome assembly protein YihI (activator of Der GTPase)